jgi:hypothetical protein
MAQHQNDAQAAISGTVPSAAEGATAATTAAATPAAATAAPSAKDQAAAIALKTLTAINDQLSAGKKTAKDGAGQEASATPTDPASVALAMLQKAEKADEAAAADKKAADAKVAAAAAGDGGKRTDGPLVQLRSSGWDKSATAPKTLAVA